MTRHKIHNAVFGLMVTALLFTAAAQAKGPTCSDVLPIATHGQHIVGDYITGLGHMDLAWPPAGMVGKAIAGLGAFLPGGPGPAYHFEEGIAPGASFCTPRAQL